MGWLVFHRGFGKKDLIEHLRNSRRFGDSHVLLRSSVVGNNHWYVCKNTQSGEVFIGLDLMAGGGKTEGWGYKDLSEDCGPNEVNCPISYLDMVGEAKGHAIAWRERVRAYHAKRKARPVPVPGLMVKYGGHVYKLLQAAGPKRGWYVERQSDKAPFRLPSRYLSKVELVQEEEHA